MKEKYFDKFVIALILLLILFAFFLQISTQSSTEKLKEDEIEKSRQYASKIAQFIKQKTDGEVEKSLTFSPELQKELNEYLHTFLTKQYKYVFVLYRDIKGMYRFLLDGSQDDAEEYKTIFFPKSKRFDDVYEKQKMEIIDQSENVEQLWLSLVYPIVFKGKTKALLVLDLSEDYGKHLNSFNSPLMNVVWMMQVVLFSSIILLLWLAYKYYLLRQNLLFDKLTAAHTKIYLDEFFNNHHVDDFYALLIDLDEFKLVNQKFSYELGDKLLKVLVSTIIDCMPKSTEIIRTAGTEFFLLVPKKSGKLTNLTKGLFKTLQEKIYLFDNEVITQYVSISAIDIPKDTKSIRNIQRILDEKMLEIKNRGKNNFSILNTKSLDEIRYGNIDYIKEALDEERCICLYQPIYDLKTDKIVKFEALVRLVDKNDTSKYITPSYFMDKIRGTSQYIKMSKQVIQHVFSILKQNPEIEISINVDLTDLENMDMMKLITENLYKYRKVASRITFEILEDNEVTDYDKVQYIIQQLKIYGSKVALDDFGSGYTNYIYLIGLDIDVIKIDGSLIKSLQTSPQRATLVLKSIQTLAKELNVELVAEFVSDESIYQLVKELGIEYVQGYYLGEPRPINDYLSKI